MRIVRSELRRWITPSCVAAIAWIASCGSHGDEPLATVGEHTVTDREFASYLQFRSLAPRGDQATQEALDEYLRREALSTAIESTDVLDQAQIDAELQEFRREMLISRYFDRYLRTAVTDEAVQNYYNEHASEYEDREIHAAHILIRTNRRMTEEERQAASTRAQEAYAQLQSGRDFAEVATQYSEDAVSASRGGDLGWVREGAIDARFSERVFETAPGTYSEPFETPFGFHIVRVVEAVATRRRPLSAVEGDIRYQLRALARDAEVERLLGAVTISEREGGYRPPAPEESTHGESDQTPGAHTPERDHAEHGSADHAGDHAEPPPSDDPVAHDTPTAPPPPPPPVPPVPSEPAAPPPTQAAPPHAPPPSTAAVDPRGV